MRNNLRHARAQLTALVALCMCIAPLAGAVEVTSPDAGARNRKPAQSTKESVVKPAGPAVRPQTIVKSRKQLGSAEPEAAAQSNARRPSGAGRPMSLMMTKAHGRVFDVRRIPSRPAKKRERPEREGPVMNPGAIGASVTAQRETRISFVPAIQSPAPSPILNFDGLDFNTWGGGHPPDTNGDVGPAHYIQTINTSIGIYNKSGAQLAAFNFDDFMSQGNFGNLCDTDNFGDPVVLYDSFEDRWIISDFAFQLDVSDNVVNPPGSFQCIAVSMTGDPVSGGWNYYSVNTAGGLGDYPKLGIWPDGLYMSVNMFDYAAAPAGSFQNVRLYAFNKAQMYAGSPTVKVVSFDLPGDHVTGLPSNARLQTGTPPAGSPNYIASIWNFLNAIELWKFHVDWDRVALSSVTGPYLSLMTFWWERFAGTGDGSQAPSPANNLDTLYPRLMVQNQYSKIGGSESLWLSHTAGAGNPTTKVLPAPQSAVRFYQLDLTGGAIAANTVQSFTYSPDSALFRFMPSVAVNRNGDMAVGYSTSNGLTNPAIAYAGRLAADPPNTISQTEQTLIAGTGSQQGNCGNTCVRWGDYSAMTLDPDGCTFWYTSQYYAVTGLDYLTRIGSFAFPCTPFGSGGTIAGTVTSSVDASPLAGATVQLGARTATTNSTGSYSFTNVRAGTYPSLIASRAGYSSQSNTSVVVSDGGTNSKNFALAASASSGCLTDTNQSDFQAGVTANTDLLSAADSVLLSRVDAVDQQSTVAGNGFGFTTTSWVAQTFTAGVTGVVTKADVLLFCANSCAGEGPSITASLRATSGGLPTGVDLGTATVSGFTSGISGTYTATFGTPVPVVAGIQYALVLRANGSLATGVYAAVCSCIGSTAGTNPYTAGSRLTSTNSGTSWTADAISRDLTFHVFVSNAFGTSGEFTSAPKDSNPAPGFGTAWSTLAWTSSVPANSTLQFQIAGSNSPDGPFNFVGPNGTAATFFTTSPATLTAFNNFRYLEYRAVFTSSNPAATAQLNDVTLCFTTVAGPSAPTGTIAVGNGTPGVTIGWASAAGATTYHVYRRDDTRGFKLVGTTGSLSFPDTTAGIAADHAYLYMVRGVSATGVESADSTVDLATTVAFAEPIVANATTVKATQVNELRKAINAVALMAGISTFSFSDPVSTNAPIKATQVNQLRTNLNSALTTLGLPAVTFADPNLTPAVTLISAPHILQLRSAVQ